MKKFLFSMFFYCATLGLHTIAVLAQEGAGDGESGTVTLEQSIVSASFVIPKKTATDITYFRKGQDYFFASGGRTGGLPVFAQPMDFLIQSQRHLIFGARQAPYELEVLEENRPFENFLVSGFQWCSTADYREGRLYLGGQSEGPRLLFKLYEAKGVVREWVAPFQKKTTIPDESIMHSLFLEDRWVVWVPSHLSLQFFDTDLNPLNAVNVAVPEHLWSISPELLDLLRAERKPEAMKKLCENHRGQPLHATPVGMFHYQGRLVLCYFGSRLKGYNPEREGYPKIDVDTFTQLLVLSCSNPEIVEIKEIPELYIYGLGSEDGRAIGKRWLGTGNHWRAELVDWN